MKSPVHRKSAFAFGCMGALLLLFASCSSEGSRTTGAVGADRGATSAPLDAQEQVRPAWVAARQAAGAGDAAYAARAIAGGGFVVTHPAMGMRAELTARGVTLSKTGEAWHATLAGARYGCADGDLATIEREGAPRVGSSDNRVEYPGRSAGVAVDEWYVHGPLGLEQGFTLGASPCGGARGGDVVIEVRLDGLEAMTGQDGNGLDLRDSGGATRARYTDLWARDARGVALAANMEAVRGGIALRVDARGARFPVTVDPLTWTQVAELNDRDGAAIDGAAADSFGLPVALSGNTALVGCPAGICVFVQSGTTWAQQAVLVPSGGGGGSLSVSGTMALVGTAGTTVGANASQGAAYVFVQSGTTWTQQAELVASDGAANDGLGGSVSLSGNLALVGNAANAAYVFAQSGTTWTQQAKLTKSAMGPGFGQTVSLSGTTALIGAFGVTVGLNATEQGAAYMFVQSGTTWTQQQMLTASDGATEDNFGIGVSISGDMALVGAGFGRAKNNEGAAYVFVRSGTTWTQQAELTGTDEVAYDQFGFEVSISGPTALVGARDGEHAVYAYAQSGTTWTQEAEISPSDGAMDFGSSLALSGNTALIGALGAAYIEALPPADGTACSVSTDCRSGFCADGVCCDSSCAQACQACDVAGSVGTCANAPAGSAGSPSCAPYRCAGSSVACPASCTGDGDCAAAAYCAAGLCVAKQASGATCTDPNQCASAKCVAGMCSGLQGNGTSCTAGDQCVNSQCVDRVCCDQPCASQCQACDVAGFVGTCSQVTGAPHGARAACAGTGTPCGATCSAGGGPTACEYAAMGTTCGSPSCSGDQVVNSACDGMGACGAITPALCPGHFACDGATQACKTTCSQSSDCAGVYSCSDGACQPTGGSTCSGPHTSMNTTGGVGDAGSTECAPYACDHDTGKCLGACKSVAECVAPDVCDPAGQCVAAPPPPANTTSSSGGCRAAPGPSPGGAWVLLGVGVVCGAARRRRRRRAAFGIHEPKA